MNLWTNQPTNQPTNEPMNQTTNQPTNQIHETQYFWEANSFSVSEEIPHIFWTPKFHYCIYKNLSPSLILSQISPLHVACVVLKNQSKSETLWDVS